MSDQWYGSQKSELRLKTRLLNQHCLEREATPSIQYFLKDFLSSSLPPSFSYKHKHMHCTYTSVHADRRGCRVEELQQEKDMQSEISSRGGNRRVSCSENNNISCYSTNEHQHGGRIEIENYFSFFFPA